MLYEPVPNRRSRSEVERRRKVGDVVRRRADLLRRDGRERRIRYVHLAESVRKCVIGPRLGHRVGRRLAVHPAALAFARRPPALFAVGRVERLLPC